MSKSKTSSKNKNDENSEDSWKLHDTYAPGVSYNRIVTRSQTAFCRLKNSKSDLELFCDPSRHQPPDMPHLMVTLKGAYGAIPNTIITRSTGKHLKQSDDLIKKVNEYKKYKPPKKAEIKKEKEEKKDEKKDEKKEEKKDEKKVEIKKEK